MKTTNIDAVPSQWTDILGWINAGEEVELRRGDQTVAKVTPWLGTDEVAPVAWPDFVGRARRIWGERASGESLVEALLSERGERA